MEELLNELKKICNELNKHHLHYGIGGSLMLYLRGFDVLVNDIDIVIVSNDFNTADSILDKTYQRVKTSEHPKFSSEHFSKFKSTISIDLFANYSIKH
jgi:hypothetical protein